MSSTQPEQEDPDLKAGHAPAGKLSLFSNIFPMSPRRLEKKSAIADYTVNSCLRGVEQLLYLSNAWLQSYHNWAIMHMSRFW